ncbi:MAG: hypothetical protein ACR2IL_08530 [Chitinophagaceae bacterium]
MMQWRLAILACFLIGFSACSNKSYDGDSYLNYPDTEMLLEQYLNGYKKLPNTFRIVRQSGEKRDTQYLKANEMPWAELETPFREAGFFNEKNDKQYRIQVLHDTLNQRMSLFYQALNEKLFTQKATIQAQWPSNKVYSMYFECEEQGVFQQRNYKLLYACGKSMQIQKTEKRFGSKEKKEIIGVQFLNGSAVPEPVSE